MKYVSLVLLLLSLPCFSQNSTNYRGSELLIYPFKQKANLSTSNRYWYFGTKKDYKKHKKEYGFNLLKGKKDIFLPLGSIADGQYIQYVETNYTYSYKAVKQKLLNYHENEIPYAIFSVKNNELNGAVYFLSPLGDTITSGFYKNNLREGLWYLDATKTAFSNYKDGKENGRCYEVNQYRSDYRKGRDSRTVYERDFKDDILLKETKTYFYDDLVTVTIKTLIDESNPNNFKERKEKDGVKFYEGYYDGSAKSKDWQYFHPNGRIEAEITYTGDTSRLGESFKKWHHHIRQIKDSDPLTLRGIVGQNYAGQEDVVILDFYNKAAPSANCIGFGDFYYANGQKRFSFRLENEEFVPDTLFHENGNPFYVMTKDMRTKEFVYEFFDESGVKTKEYRDEFNRRSKTGESYMMYHGVKLSGNRDHDNFRYEHVPEFDLIKDVSDTIVYTEVEFEDESLKLEVYYLPDEKVRVETRDITEKYGPIRGGSRYEKRQYFNDDFTNCRTKVVTYFADGLKIYQEYDATYSTNFYQAEFQGRKLDGYATDMHYQASYGNTYTEYFSFSDREIDNNRHLPEISISNLKTEYSYNDKPFEGKLKLKLNSNRYKYKINKRKLVFLVYDYRSAYFLDHYKLSDGFDAAYIFGGFELLPNLYEQIPNISKSPQNIIKEVKGDFENGQFKGDWSYYSYKNKKIIECTYDNNELINELTYHTFIRRSKRRDRRNMWGGEYNRKREYFKCASLYFNGKQKDYMIIFNKTEDTLAFLDYENGLANSAEYFNIKGNEIVNGGVLREKLEFKEGEIQNLFVEFKGDKGSYTYHYKEGIPDGPFEYDLHKGTFNDGRFTGVLANSLGHGKIHREFLNEGIVMKENISNSDDIVLSEIVYDTNTVKLNGSINSIYSVSDHITFMEFRDDLTSPKNAVEGDFKSFYENGQVHAAGVLSSSEIKPKIGEWVYYNPEGEVVNKVTYNLNFELEGDLKHLDSYGDISFYENGELVSRGLIIDLIEKFNCVSADNYEIRQIVITEDINNGQVTKNPSRYHKSYYDMGVLQSEGELKNGVPVGIWKFYDRQGGLRSLGNYVNGRKDGRWLEGDLTGLGFIGDFCIAPDNYEINKELLESNVNLTIKFFSAGSLIKKDEFKARLEK